MAFEPGGEDWKLEDDHLAKMIELTGQTFPEKMLERANLREEYFDDTGMWAMLHFGLKSNHYCTGIVQVTFYAYPS